MVIVYPEAVIYGPVTPEDTRFLVEEHLVKGRVAAGLQASARELSGRIAWLSARRGTLPAEQRIVARTPRGADRAAAKVEKTVICPETQRARMMKA